MSVCKTLICWFEHHDQPNTTMILTNDFRAGPSVCLSNGRREENLLKTVIILALTFGDKITCFTVKLKKNIYISVMLPNRKHV